LADEDFRVELDAFSGPLDLLLYLVQKEEVDVHDIPVARILERYLEVLRASPSLDLDRAGEFLVMASTLLAIKSALLLPNEDPELGEVVDPREELVRQLIEYRRAKEAGRALGDLREQAALRWPRGSAPLPEVPSVEGEEPPGVREATLYDVFATFHRLLRETESAEPRRILYDDVPMESHVDRILGAVAAGGGRAGLLALLGARRDRKFVLGTFLAILELMKEGKLFAVQVPPPDPSVPGAAAGIDVVLQDSEAGRAVSEQIRERARRIEETSPAERPRKRPPWRTETGAAPAVEGAPPPEPPPGGPGTPPGDDPGPPPPPPRSQDPSSPA
jgi:segregation and condensation protein A